MALADIYSYFETLDDSTFNVFSCESTKPSESDIEDFERSVGFRLPDEFRQFTMSYLGGLYIEVKEDLWPRPELYQVGPFWSFLYGLKVFGISKDVPEWLDLRVQTTEMVEAGYKDLVPFLQLECETNKYCFNSQGQIFEWNHEDPDERNIIDMTFSELLMREIRELEIRKDQKMRGEDKRPPQIPRQLQSEYQKAIEGNKPCPFCGKPLRTNQAQQCFLCGADWHRKTM